MEAETTPEVDNPEEDEWIVFEGPGQCGEHLSRWHCQRVSHFYTMISVSMGNLLEDYVTPPVEQESEENWPAGCYSHLRHGTKAFIYNHQTEYNTGSCSPEATCYCKSLRSLSDCEMLLPRYPVEIAAQFEAKAVVPRGKGQNIFCECRGSLMLCTIVVRPDSFEEKFVNARFRNFDFKNPEGLNEHIYPFFVLYNFRPSFNGFSVASLFFNKCSPPVLAEIQVQQSDTHPLSRSVSFNGPLHYPVDYIPLRLCLEKECPVMHTPFTPNEIVYILTKDEDDLKHGKSVICITAMGIRKWASTKRRENSPWTDPLRREGDRPLSIETDYKAYILYDDSAPSCHSGTALRNSNSQTDENKLSTEFSLGSTPLTMLPAFGFVVYVLWEAVKLSKLNATVLSKKMKTQTIPGLAGREILASSNFIVSFWICGRISSKTPDTHFYIEINESLNHNKC